MARPPHRDAANDDGPDKNALPPFEEVQRVGVNLKIVTDKKPEHLVRIKRRKKGGVGEVKCGCFMRHLERNLFGQETSRRTMKIFISV